MATFSKRAGPGGKAVWQAMVRRKGHKQQTCTFDTKGDGQRWAEQIEAEMGRGVFVSRTAAESTTLDEALVRYQKEVSSRKASLGREASTVRAWQGSALACRYLAAIRGRDIADWVREREGEGYSANTIRLHLALLSHLFNTARTAWGMESLTNPVDLVKGQRPKLPPGRTRRLEEGEETRLLAAAKTYGGEIGLIITWAIETAMRRGELAGMQWGHVNRESGIVLLPKTKNGTARRVPLSQKARSVLDAMPSALAGPVWAMRPDSISQAFERVCKAAGVKGLTFHDLRHEATSRFFEKGLNPMQVAAITGHKTLQMLKRYTHLRAEDLVGLLD